MFATYLPVHIAKEQKGEAWEPPKKSSAFSEIE
jgi:hypothetical protein